MWNLSIVVALKSGYKGICCASWNVYTIDPWRSGCFREVTCYIYIRRGSILIWQDISNLTHYYLNKILHIPPY